MPLTDRDREVLAELEAAYRNHVSVGLSGWVQPMDCGGCDCSDHSYRLNKLVRMGYAESRKRGGWGIRGSKSYRIVDPHAVQEASGGAEGG